MEKGVVKLMVLNGEDFGQCRAILEIVQEAYVIPAMLDNMTQGQVQRSENNCKALNFITIALCWNV
jgi:hypothetical protein